MMTWVPTLINHSEVIIMGTAEYKFILETSYQHRHSEVTSYE